ncbi:hypothetical protein VTN77DRAFT_6178 [Rasamsonia byssochlamydoides]|uniref:uncharacterized protein n=1 Tax=Rasamsonia byssochlamydoides TaxID=89139 RepID=UPI0037440470
MRYTSALIPVWSAATIQAFPTFSIWPQDRGSAVIEREQEPILIHESHPMRAIHANPITAIKNNRNLQFFTDISIGNPPQVFRSLVDIAWSDLFVPSTECQDESMQVYAAGLEIKDQQFHELETYLHIPSMLWPRDFDAVLGLAPSNEASFAKIPNPFQQMMSQGLLEANVISLSLGGTAADTSIPGEIMYGGINHALMDGELVRLPVTDTRDANLHDPFAVGPPVLNGTWQVEAHSIAWGDAEDESVSLDGFTAILSTRQPFPGTGSVRTVDCQKRDSLPTLTFNLAGHDFTLSPYEYTVEVSMGYLGLMCIVSTAPLDRWSLPPDEPDFIVLGSSFLRGYYTVLDFDQKEVGLAPAKYRTGPYGL